MDLEKEKEASTKAQDSQENTQEPQEVQEETPEQKRIHALEAKIKELENQKVERITKTVIKPPDDYNNVIRNGQRLKDENLKLKKVIACGNISTLEMLIEEYTSKSKPMLKSIATEIQLTNYDVEQIKSIYEFINYLDYVRDELSSFVSIHEEGRFVLSPKLRACAMAAESIRKKLGRKSTIAKIRPEQQDAFHQTLLNFIDMIDDFLSAKGEKK